LGTQFSIIDIVTCAGWMVWASIPGRVKGFFSPAEGSEWL